MALPKKAKSENNGYAQENLFFEDTCCMTKSAKQKTNNAAKNSENNQAQKSQQKATKIVVKCDCGFSNNLYIRGEGLSGLSWEKGAPMKNTKADEWVWETHKPFNKAQFKVVLNDKQYEVGENHLIECGKQVNVIPNF